MLREIREKFEDNDCGLRKHEEMAHEIYTNGDQLSCSKCDKTFSHMDRLRTHERVHTYEKPFNCSMCDKRFCRSHHLKQHEITHTDERPFNC